MKNGPVGLPPKTRVEWSAGGNEEDPYELLYLTDAGGGGRDKGASV